MFWAALLMVVASLVGRLRVFVASLTNWPRLVAAGAMVASTALVWAPFARQPTPLYSYWDGPHYAYLAKTFYEVPPAHPFTPYGLTPAYYATHLPAYPLLIRVLTPVTGGRYMVAMLLATLVSAAASAVLYYEVLVRFQLVSSPLWTAVLFAFIPPRWVIYHSVGASEPLFLVFVFAALLAYRAERTGLLVLAVAAASLTRVMGLLMIPAFMLAFLLDRRFKQALAVPLAGLSVVALFGWHLVLYGDFWAYFTRNLGQSGHVAISPLPGLRAFASAGPGSVHSAELYLGLYAVYALGLAAIWRHRPIFFYSLALFVFNIFVFHFDLSRMFIPLAPFALLVGFDGLLSHRAARALLPLWVVLDLVYAWGAIPHNAVAPDVYRELCRAVAC